MTKLTNQKSRQWNRLDNAAKIFPSTGDQMDTKVFRFACELQEPVDPEVLQQALDQNMEMFPMFRSILKKGLFWYYLEASELKPIIRPENKIPCSPLYDKNAKNLLFEITYFHSRINLEVYHALTDGTGALHFLRFLVYHYLILKYKDELGENVPLMDYDASQSQKVDDSFVKYYNGNTKTRKLRVPKAFQIRGARNSENRIRIIEGVTQAKDLLAKAREQNTSITVMLAAIFAVSIYKTMSVRERKRPVVLSIPVNLRNYFESSSERNFFSVVKIGYDFGTKPADLPSVIHDIHEQFQNELRADNLEEKMAGLLAWESNVLVRVLPLSLKDIILKIVNKVDANSFTVSLSNVGRVEMPLELKPYIRLFDVFIGTNKLQICMCSYDENMIITFTSCFASSEIQKNFFRMLTEMGISIEIVSN